jgi:hypothetical protein
MRRDIHSECEPGDWVMMMEAPDGWLNDQSPVTWVAGAGKVWHFAFTEVPIIDPVQGEVGTDYVWMRYDPQGPIPRPPTGPVGFRPKEQPSTPADWWK